MTLKTDVNGRCALRLPRASNRFAANLVQMDAAMCGMDVGLRGPECAEICADQTAGYWSGLGVAVPISEWVPRSSWARRNWVAASDGPVEPAEGAAEKEVGAFGVGGEGGWRSRRR